MVVDPGIGGQGQVRQQQAGEVPGAGAQVQIQALGAGLMPRRALGGEP